MIHLTLDQLLLLHEIATGRRPAVSRVANARALGYCVLRPQQEQGGLEAFDTPAAKAAALLQAIIVTQPFADGNRRTAWVASRTLLHLNGYRLTGKPQEISSLLDRVKRGEATFAELRDWINARLEPITWPSTRQGGIK